MPIGPTREIVRVAEDERVAARRNVGSVRREIHVAPRRCSQHEPRESPASGTEMEKRLPHAIGVRACQRGDLLRADDEISRDRRHRETESVLSETVEHHFFVALPMKV